MIWTNSQGETLAVPNIRHLSNIKGINGQFRFVAVSDSDNDNNALSGIDCFFPTLKEAEYQLKVLTDLLEEYHGFAGTFVINDYVLVIPFIKQVSRIVITNNVAEFVIYFIGRTVVHVHGDPDSIQRRRDQLTHCIDDYWGQKRKSMKTLRAV